MILVVLAAHQLNKSQIIMNSIDKIATNIYLFIIFISIIIGVYFKMVKRKEFCYLVLLLALTFIVESIANYKILDKSFSRGWIYVLFVPIQYFLLSFYFRQIINSKTIKNYIFISIILIIGWNTYNPIFLYGINNLNYNNILLSCILFCIWSILYFIQLLKTDTNDNISQNSNFWICTGTLFFYSSSFFIIGFIQFIYKEDFKSAEKLWSLIRVFNILLYGLYAYGLICQAKYQNLHTSR